MTRDSLLAKRDAMLLAYWERMPTVDEARAHCANLQGVPMLKPLKKPCHDCAVTCGFYEPIAATLSLLQPAEIEARSLEWYCHNNTRRACAGNIEYQRALKLNA